MSGTPQTMFEVENPKHVSSAAIGSSYPSCRQLIPNDADGARHSDRQAIRVAGLDVHLTDLMVTHSVAHAVQEMMPKKILARAKREVRRDMREPSDVTIRDYYNHLQRINLLELHHLPPFGAGQIFANDDDH